MKFIDTHMHVTPSEYTNYKEIINNAFKNGVSKMFVVGCEIKTIPETLKVAQEFDGLFPIIGIHPNDVKGDSDIKFIREHLTSDVIAIGEIGLDLHYENNPPLKLQIEILEKQLDLALEYKLPVVIHSRDADEETYNVLKQTKYKSLKIIMHSYAYGNKGMQKYLDLGCFLSFSGIVTFKNAQDFKEAVINVPINRLLSETDSPYLAPVPHRGQKNEPTFVIDTVKYISELKNISLKKITDAINENVKEIFNI